MARKITMNGQSRKSVAEVFEDFVLSQMAQGLSDITIATYRHHIHSISNHLDIQKPMEALTRKDLEAMIVSMRASGLAHNSISSYCRVFRTFSNWCRRAGLNIPELPNLKDKETVKEAYADTGMEFPEMYAHIAKLDAYLYEQRGIHITILRHPQGFEYLMFDEPKTKPKSIENRIRLGVPLVGNGWPGIRVRWCTGALKTKLIDKEVKRLKGELGAIHYIGIAADEAWRCKGEKYPLVEWGITEAQALQICYDRGYDFGGLYEIYNRASCWCCPFQRIGELRKLRKCHPELWAKLLEMDRRAREQFGPGPLGQFKKDWSVDRLEERFAKEDCQQNTT